MLNILNRSTCRAGGHLENRNLKFPALPTGQAGCRPAWKYPLGTFVDRSGSNFLLRICLTSEKQ